MKNKSQVGIITDNWSEFEMNIKKESEKRFKQIWKESVDLDTNITLGETNMLNICLMAIHEQVKNI